MPIPFTCPFCGNHTMVADQFAGKSGPCSKYGATITVPASAGMARAPLPRLHPRLQGRDAASS
jgi:hypothetical protein